MSSKEPKWTQTLPQSIYCSKSLIKDIRINAYYIMMKYEMKEILNWKQVKIILWKEQKRHRKKRDKWRKKEVEEQWDNDRTYQERWC